VAGSDTLTSIEQIRNIPIMDIYNSYICGKIIRRGNNYWTSCPWHGSDSDPSLKIYVSQNKYWCYGCNSGGTQIDMVMHALDLAVSDAIKRLESDFNITGTRDIKQDRERQTKLQIQRQFERDFNRIFVNLCKLNHSLIKMSQDIKIIIKHPCIFMHQLRINNLLDEMCSKNETEQVQAWRKSKRRYDWM